MADKKISVTFNGETVNCVDISLIDCAETNCDKCQSGDDHRDLEWLNTDHIIELANEQDSPFSQFTEIAIRTDDIWLIAENRDKNGMLLFRRMVPIKDVYDIAIRATSLKTVY